MACSVSKLIALACAAWLACGVCAVHAGERTLASHLSLTFVDADGRTVRSPDFAGKWLLVYFGYIHCADLCPTGLTVLANALEETVVQLEALIEALEEEAEDGEDADDE